MNYLALKSDKITVEKDLYNSKVEKIKPGVYDFLVHPHPLVPTRLSYQKASYGLPKKLFGDVEKKVDIFFSAYKKRSATGMSTGVLLTGHKGTGKTLTAEALCAKGLKFGLPVLQVTEAISPSDIRMFASQGPCIVYMDEIEKVYGRISTTEEEERTGQDPLLSLFSDSSLPDVLWVVTGNQIEHMNPYFFNRPGRFLFHLHHPNTIEAETLKEICEYHQLPDWYQSMVLLQQKITEGGMTIDDVLAHTPYLKGGVSWEAFFEKTKYLNIVKPELTTVSVIKIDISQSDYDIVYEDIKGGNTAVLRSWLDSVRDSMGDVVIVDDGVVKIKGLGLELNIPLEHRFMPPGECLVDRKELPLEKGTSLTYLTVFGTQSINAIGSAGGRVPIDVRSFVDDVMMALRDKAVHETYETKELIESALGGLKGRYRGIIPPGTFTINPNPNGYYGAGHSPYPRMMENERTSGAVMSTKHLEPAPPRDSRWV